MLERDGEVLATTGPVRHADARLRRAQACAGQSEFGVEIARELIARKLIGQERVAREQLRDESAAEAIVAFRHRLNSVKAVDEVRTIEARAAAAYWGAWSRVRFQF